MQRTDNSSETAALNAELFHLVIENVRDYAVFTTDEKGTVNGWNAGAENLLGYREDEIVGQPIALIYTAEDQAASVTDEEMERAAHGGRAEGKRWHRRRDGSRFWANGLLVPLKNDDGTVRGFAKLVRDETERKLTEDDLERSNRRVENVLMSISDAFYTFDREFRYVYVNEATTRMFDRTEAEFLGKTLWEIFPDVAGNRFHKEIARAFENQTPTVFENYYPPFDRWFENRVYPTADGLSIFTTEITERKRAEAALRESEEKYRTLFDSIDEGFCIIELIFDDKGKAVDYTFVDLNSSFERHSGLVNAKGKRLREFVPDYEDFWFETYGRVALTGEAVRFDNHSEAFNRWWDVYAFRIEEPEMRRVAVLFNDITKRKQAEIAVQEGEERYRALVEATATTVWHANAEGGLSFVGESWTRVSGQNVEDILKWGWLEAVHPDDRERTVEIWRRSLAAKTLYATEFRVLTAAGEYRWFAVSAVPIFEADGSVREWIGANIDITARKRAEEERAESLKQLEIERSRLAYIFEHSPPFVAVLRGSEHIFELTNPAYLKLIGHHPVIGKTVREALPETAEQGYFELLDQVFQSGESFIGNEMAIEFRYAPDIPPEQKYVDLVFQPMFGADGETIGIFVHGVDITEQVAARKEAETANRLKDEFLATLSHELRTPLNAILGWSQMLQSRQVEETTREKALATIERSARAQNQLIEDILDVSRIITGKLRLNIRAVDLPNVIAAAIDSVRPAAEAKNIRLQTLLDPQAGPLSGDPDRLQQVVWNLLSNAVKFTPKNGRIQVRLERVNSHVEIVVSDTGKGIEAGFLPHVFDRFRQSDGSMTRRHGGLGLGLAIVRQLVELHGGTVSADSAGDEQGSIFTVHLPLLPVRREPISAAARVHPQTEVDISAACPPELDGLRILIVDDEADSQYLLKSVLESCGATTLEADSAAQAMAVLEREKFDVVVSDIGMPEEDGFSLIRRIRNLSEDHRQTPAIALTAYARAEDRVQAMRAGFQMHIAKPVEPTELIAAVASLAGRMSN